MGILAELNYPFDAAFILRKRKSLRRELLSRDVAWLEKKIAILGGSSTQDIASMLEVFLLNEGIKAQIYQSEYGQYREDALFGTPELDEFKPDLIIFHTGWRNLRETPRMTDSPDEVSSLLEKEKTQWQSIWESVAERYHCAIIQNNFDLPPWRLLGNLDSVDPRGLSNFIHELNSFFAMWARTHSGFFIHDQAYVAADYGLSRWHDLSCWHLFKYGMAVNAIPGFCYSLTSMIRSIWGRGKKALALDLDNTLWGGVIGDDGVDGIVLGPEMAGGAAYQEFQTYVRRLREIGVILTVNSKNDEVNALAGLNHPHGCLKPDDFALIKANWQPKDRNIVETAETISIRIDSFVFVDDNPVERELVTTSLPQVSAPPLDRVENYIHLLDRAAYFEPVSLTEEDMARSRMYTENAQRAVAQLSFTDYSSYLKGLEMKAVIGPFSEAHVARVTQLTNKTNQFNLTTRRYTESEIRHIMESDHTVGLFGSLADKYGDNGIVSVMIGDVQGDICHIDLWLMSCRVLKRGMEQVMLNVMMEECRRRGVSLVKGKYIPTSKNGMVKDLYKGAGFTLTERGEDGSTAWECQTAEYEEQAAHIELITV